jgi:hypothetical protein
VWRNSRFAALTLALASTFAGCALDSSIHSGGKASYPERNEVPIAANFRTSNQLKLQAAEHWRRAASHSASALIKSLQGGGACIPKTGCRTLYLRRSCDTTGCMPRSCDTTFNRVFFNQFLTALVGLGYQVTAVPTTDAIMVDVDIQAVAFSSNRPQYRYAGEPVEIGPGIWALRDATTLVDKDGNAGLRTAGYDSNWFRAEFAAGATPRNELVITVSAMSWQRTYVARNTRVYYTADSDAALYACSGGVSRETRTWTIPVTGDCTGPRCRDDLERGR